MTCFNRYLIAPFVANFKHNKARAVFRTRAVDYCQLNPSGLTTNRLHADDSTPA